MVGGRAVRRQGWDPASSETVRRAYTAAAASADTAPTQINIGYWEAFGLAAAGHLDAARASLRRFDGIAPYVRYMIDIFRCPIELAAGRVQTVARMCRDSVLYTPGNGGGWSELLHAMACQAHASAGDRARAADALDVAEEHHEPQFKILDPFRMLAPAWLVAAEGAVSQAVELAAVAAEAARASQQWAVEVHARHTAVCFGDAGQAPRLAELAAQVYGPRSDAAAVHAAALGADDPGGLLAAADALESAGLLLMAADASAQAAALHRRLGRSAEAMATSARAAELARCEGACTPALAAALTPLPLTAREREIATMIHTGLSNKQIADRLRLSVRTVEGHVYRACTKLSVPDRATLAELVGKLS